MHWEAEGEMQTERESKIPRAAAVCGVTSIGARALFLDSLTPAAASAAALAVFFAQKDREENRKKTHKVRNPLSAN